MIPEYIIEKAKEGGWFSGMDMKYDHNGGIHFNQTTAPRWVWVSFKEIALDPLFWQALGKELGWTNNLWVGDMKRLLLSGELESVRWELTMTEQHAHHFFDLILNGEPTDEFWKEVANTN